MKHIPILFSTEMVQAILKSRKTQTRRVVKPQPMHDSAPPFRDGNQWLHMGDVYKCPYGQPGDVLWVRETWCYTGSNEYLNLQTNLPFFYKADVKDSLTEKEVMNHYGWKWKPSIHMPREAARLFLRIKDVRVERLQEISEDDACEEGIEVKTMPNADAGDYNCYPRNYMISEKDADGWPYFNEEQYIESFRTLWQSINGPESWDANPWVWVVEFERITREEAEV